MKLELRPYTALAILSLCREFVNDDSKSIAVLAAIHESIQEYEDEVLGKISSHDLIEALSETNNNVSMGRQPDPKV